MRVIAEIRTDAGLDPLSFSQLLSSHGIRHEIEERDGDSKAPLFRIWVFDEDEIEHASKLFDAYRKNPDQYQRPAAPLSAPLQRERLANESAGSGSEGESEATLRKNPLVPKFGFISILVLAATIFIFIWGQSKSELRVPPPIHEVAEAPVLSGLEQKLLFDYPHYFELRDKLLTLYTPAQIKEGEKPSEAAQSLIHEMEKTPFWNGIYDRFINHIHNKSVPLKYEGPLMEKIGQGEFWRLFSPALLHYDFLHIFFNVLWFIILSNQIEFRIGSIRYLFFLLVAAVASNSAQYLMTGSFFMGLSGLICAMAAFIWARQQVAPWEGYILNRMTIIFLLIFVLGIFGLQVVFFFLELLSPLKLQLAIANTAHLVGGLVGYGLGRLKFFSLKSHRLG